MFGPRIYPVYEVKIVIKNIRAEVCQHRSQQNQQKRREVKGRVASGRRSRAPPEWFPAILEQCWPEANTRGSPAIEFLMSWGQVHRFSYENLLTGRPVAYATMPWPLRTAGEKRQDALPAHGRAPSYAAILVCRLFTVSPVFDRTNFDRTNREGSPMGQWIVTRKMAALGVPPGILAGLPAGFWLLTSAGRSLGTAPGRRRR